MSCLSSCLAPLHRNHGGDADDSVIKSRRVLVRNSLEQTEFSYRRSSARDDTVYAHEKLARDERQSLIDDYDEDAEEQSTLISEKHLEASSAVFEHGDFKTLEKRLVRKSAGFRWLKKPGRESPAELQQRNDTDELHRQAEFERHVRKLSPDQAERAWTAEHERRQRWKLDRKTLA
ncbi:hypothetical protein EJ04DRAFT_575851 [Polyplosphaeria fusca]|uniref:Uncharacterized protein n=1 Tax=Polyplosphaeria fusca TaxID=682080 RepID=A0A9P4R2X3_9PLEO|nr:hypothetical protein EJ04DRAFT_575851 [Polyplosphaeria fusca]